MPTKSPLHPLLDEINRAAQAGLPFLAVTMTVTLPDICVSLASEDGRSNRDRYKNWCANHLGEGFSFLTPDDLYSIRCGVVHNGRFGDLQHNVERVIFALPDGNSFQNCQIGDAYFYSVVDFCRNFTGAVDAWFETNKDATIVQQNLPKLMQYRVGGFAPYIGGATVLA
ncbi:hypothetical protein [Salinisphaera hydrothermalis]|uniref:hypothetical protein n=1 Tax=Salinisphaera hydrothermalis TaxID=563188 RepID=UPI0033416191